MPASNSGFFTSASGGLKRSCVGSLYCVVTAMGVVVAVGVDPSRALVLSQVVLSFGIPFALIPLVLICRDRRAMGNLVNRPATNVAAYVVTTVIVGLNLFLLQQTLFA